MSPAVAERPRLFRDPPAPFGTEDAPRRPLTRQGGDRLTLEQKLDRVWEGLSAAGAAEVECPVCGAAGAWTHGEMASQRAFRCRTCASTVR